ncbi:MAG: hypothetical protein EXS05_06225 [Planctomycetaceae bacterium]|nr:hypothetical protein [Planctomycetaceae bacterium]
MRYEVRELGLGGILDQAVLLTRSRLRTLLGISLVVDIPFNLVTQFIVLAMTPLPPPNPTLADQQVYFLELVKLLFALLPLLLLDILIIVPISKAALIHALAGEYLDRPAGMKESLKRALRRPFGLFGTSFLLYLPVGVGFFFCVIPGVIAYLFFALSTPVFVLEGIAGISALQRSIQLSKGNVTSFFALLFLLAVVNWQIMFVPSLIPQDYLRIVSVVLLAAVLSAFRMAALVAFYFSCRCQHEQFDLTYLAESVSAAPPVPTDAEVV